MPHGVGAYGLDDVTSRQRLRSSASHRLAVPPVRLSTVGRRGFPVSGASISTTLDRTSLLLYTVARGFQTASQNIPILTFIPGHHHDFHFLTASVDLAVIAVMSYLHIIFYKKQSNMLPEF